MTKMEILLKITPAVSIVRKLTPKMEEKHHQNRRSLYIFTYIYIEGFARFGKVKRS